MTGAGMSLLDSVGASDRTEAELLVTCATTCVDQETESRILELSGRCADWPKLVQLARTNHVVPLLYATLSRTRLARVPEEAMDSLQRLSFDNARRSLVLTRELLELHGELEAAGISAAAFKGPILAELAYRNLSLRQYTDLDILIKESDARRAVSLLLSLGYERKSDSAPRMRSEPVDVFVRNGKVASVDLHWGMSRSFLPFAIEKQGLWERMRAERLADALVLTPAPEDLLLILCMHGSRHLWNRLGWVCDVAELIRSQPQLQWEQVMTRAERLGSERMLLLGIILAVDLLSARVPEEILRRARGDTIAISLSGAVLEHMFPGRTYRIGAVKAFAFRLKVRDRLRDRVPNVLRFAHRTLTPNEKDRTAVRLPKALSWLYYAVRIVRVVAMYAGSPMRRFGSGSRPQ